MGAPSAALTDADSLALCVYREAAGEPDDGKATFAHVVLERQRLHYASEGTLRGRVTWHSQFSWCEFDAVDGAYRRGCEGPAAIAARAVQLLAKAKADAAWPRCASVAGGADGRLRHRLGQPRGTPPTAPRSRRVPRRPRRARPRPRAADCRDGASARRSLLHGGLERTAIPVCSLMRRSSKSWPNG